MKTVTASDIVCALKDIEYQCATWS